MTRIIVLLALVLVQLAPTQAVAAETVLVSVDASGSGDGNGESILGNTPQAGISSRGQLIAFQSDAENLVANDTNLNTDVFVRNLKTGTTTLVSVNHAGTASGNRRSWYPAISGNGRFVVFESEADDLVPNDTNGSFDVFVRDLKLGTTSLVSINLAGTDSGAGESYDAHIDARGRFVSFFSGAEDLTSTLADGANVYVRDLKSGITSMVGINLLGNGVSLGVSDYARLSADGKFVVFNSSSPDLVPSGTNGYRNVFVRDLRAGTTHLVSVNQAQTGGGNNSSYINTRELGNCLEDLYPPNPISKNGRFIVFTSRATNLVGNDVNGVEDVFVRDMRLGTASLVSINQPGTSSGNSESGCATVSAKGTVVAFESYADDLAVNDNNGDTDVFVRNLATGATTLASVNSSGTGSGNGSSWGAGLSANGKTLVFTSEADNLAPNDTNADNPDVFVRDLAKATSTLVSVNHAGTASGDNNSQYPQLSGNGKVVVFQSYAGDLTPLPVGGFGWAVFARYLK